MLHLNCTALSQSESSNFLMCIIGQLIKHADKWNEDVRKNGMYLGEKNAANIRHEIHGD